MGEDIDKHVLRKYEVQQKLGKGVNLNFRRCLLSTPHHEHFTGVWRRVEIGWQEDTWYSCSEKDIRCISECHGRSGTPWYCRILRDNYPAVKLLNHQRTFREIMFLQEVNNHENIIRYRFSIPQSTPARHQVNISWHVRQIIKCSEGRERQGHLPDLWVYGNWFARRQGLLVDFFSSKTNSRERSCILHEGQWFALIS